MTIRAFLTGLALFAAANAAYSAEQQSEWTSIPGSHDTNFRIQCFEGTNRIWGIYPRNGTSDYQVARDIYIKTLPDSRVMLTFKRGFTWADIPTSYIPASNVSCEFSGN